jgi:hypothetical protein
LAKLFCLSVKNADFVAPIFQSLYRNITIL